MNQIQFPSFGRSMRSEFLFEDGYISLNQGTYGTIPKPVLKAFRTFQERAERAPDRWIRSELTIELTKTREKVASFINANSEDIGFVQNTTTGINSVLQSLKYEPGDKVSIEKGQISFSRNDD
jgi:selenocysteine lyase/cysteine desulfurase